MDTNKAIGDEAAAEPNDRQTRPISQYFMSSVIRITLDYRHMTNHLLKLIISTARGHGGILLYYVLICGNTMYTTYT